MTYPVQNHIHLDLPTNISEAPELAPVATYTVLEREMDLEVSSSFTRSWNGTPFYAAVADENGTCIFTNFRYTLRVSQAQLETLESLFTKHVLLVDNRHPNNGSAHTAAIQHMRFDQFRYEGADSTMLERHKVTILLRPEPSEYAT